VFERPDNARNSVGLRTRSDTVVMGPKHKQFLYRQPDGGHA
jgi:hypothetical protein